MTDNRMETIPAASRLTFNIIIVPGSFAIQGSLIMALLRRLRCNFRLVSNGCGGEENRRMEAFCRDIQQKGKALQFHVLPVNGMVDHGTALNRLQQMETSRYFCFMDADILATHDFLTELLPLMSGHAAMFSGRPLWQSQEETILPAGQNRIMGRYLRTGNGLMLGSSYFAIYRNDLLKRFVNDHGFCFDRLSWPDLPPRTSLLLVKMGLHAAYYDTGKILNILLQERGLSLAYHEPQGLTHIGGLSCGVAAASNPTASTRRPPQATRLKWQLATHFLDWHRALVNGLPLPPTPPIPGPEIREKVERTKEQIRTNYNEFKDLY